MYLFLQPFKPWVPGSSPGQPTTFHARIRTNCTRRQHDRSPPFVRPPGVIVRPKSTPLLPTTTAQTRAAVTRYGTIPPVKDVATPPRLRWELRRDTPRELTSPGPPHEVSVYGGRQIPVPRTRRPSPPLARLPKTTVNPDTPRSCGAGSMRSAKPVGPWAAERRTGAPTADASLSFSPDQRQDGDEVAETLEVPNVVCQQVGDAKHVHGRDDVRVVDLLPPDGSLAVGPQEALSRGHRLLGQVEAPEEDLDLGQEEWRRNGAGEGLRPSKCGQELADGLTADPELPPLVLVPVDPLPRQIMERGLSDTRVDEDVRVKEDGTIFRCRHICPRAGG